MHLDRAQQAVQRSSVERLVGAIDEALQPHLKWLTRGASDADTSHNLDFVVRIPLIQIMIKASGMKAQRKTRGETNGKALHSIGAKMDSKTQINVIESTVEKTGEDATGQAARTITDGMENALGRVVANPDYDAAKSAQRACFDLAGKFGLECARRWWDSYQGGNMWAGTASYCAAVRDVLKLELEEFEAYQAWEDAAKEGGFRILHEEFCIVSNFPQLIKTDAENRPHCEDGPSHQWRDGWKLYHWHGQQVPAEWIEDKASLTAEKALTWTNVEQRRAACEILGWATVLEQLPHTVIDEDKPEVGKLVEAMIQDLPERFLFVRCGTGRDFAMHVDKSCKTAMEAQAWMLNIPVSDFQLPEVRT